MNEKYLKIPNFVKNNKSISNSAKILYGDLVLLSHKNGYCYASNKFLAEGLNITTRSITRLLKELKDANLIEIIFTESYNRRIYLVK